MAVFKLFSRFPCVLFVVVLLSEIAEGIRYSNAPATTNQKRKIEHKPIKADLGATCKLRCKLPSKSSHVQWFKDGLELNATKSSGYQIKKRPRQGVELLKILKMSGNNCGTFECRVKNKNSDRMLSGWRIELSGGSPLSIHGFTGQTQSIQPRCQAKGGKCRRQRRTSPGGKIPVCGRAGKGTHCGDPNFPDCTSFAGEPLDIRTQVFIDKGEPVVQIRWKPPSIGYNDLWGYQVHIMGRKGHAGHSRCTQINSKEDKEPHVTFGNILYGAEYELRLQSMPSKKMVEKKVFVKGKCEFDEFKLGPSCCAVTDLNSTVNIDLGRIFLSWSIHCENESVTTKHFYVSWVNLQTPKRCSGWEEIQNAVSVNSRFNYSIVLSKECQQYNYSIKVQEINGTRERLIVSYPQKTVVPSAIVKNDNNTKTFAAVSGIIFGLALVALFFIYKYCFTKVVLKLPELSQGPPVPIGRSQSGEPLLNEGIKRVFLMSPRCCYRCKWVVHCLGELLASTGMVEVRADLWFENEISRSVLRWYEEEIRQANCVIVLASRKMARWNQRTTASDQNSDDLLDITAQLNLVSGEITRDPNSPKFIPAYFEYNGQAKDIPDFLSSRLAHKLPNDLDRLIYHVLNIEAIQPYRTRPIVVLGGDGHPFESRKKDLLRAVGEAEEEHSRIENENNNRISIA